MSDQDYRLWIEEARESHLTDKELLQSLTEGSRTPFGIAGANNRVSTVRTQCHYLNQLEYINKTSIGTYIITVEGEEALAQRASFDEGYVRLEEEMKLGYKHVTDLGELLDADTIIQINKRILHHGEDRL